MNYLKYIFFFTIIASSVFCQTYQIYQSDTINRIDKEHKKQGHWIVFSIKPKCNADGITLEKGIYQNNKKTGVWEEFYCTGILKNKITFNNGRPDGLINFYYENGKLHETGIWKNSKWVEKYREYDTTGKFIREQELDSLGRKEGLTIFNFVEHEPFLVNGKAALYNTKKQLLKEGIFKDSRLMDGKAYIYDEKGALSRVTLYMTGIYAGDLPK